MFVQRILQQHPEAGHWHQQYPWFSIGQLLFAAGKKDTPEFTAAAQKTAIFFNDISRLHWLLHAPPATEAAATDGQDLLPATASERSLVVSETTAADTAASGTSSVVAPDFTLVTPISLPEPDDMLLAAGSSPEDPEDPEPEPATEAEEEQAATGLPTHLLSASLAQMAETLKQEAGQNEELVFQSTPRHTIDYFASQGIQLDQDTAYNDQFGRQLKTFTSWLRQMKPLVEAPQQDPLVDRFASHSLHKGEVLTESMVDILLKQGKKEHAIEVLEKLRLLYPEKSVYFAARIEQFK